MRTEQRAFEILWCHGEKPWSSFWDSAEQKFSRPCSLLQAESVSAPQRDSTMLPHVLYWSVACLRGEKGRHLFTFFQLKVHHSLWQIEKMLTFLLHYRTDSVSSCPGHQDIPVANIVCLETDSCQNLCWYWGQQPRRRQRRETKRRTRKLPWNQTCQIEKLKQAKKLRREDEKKAAMRPKFWANVKID